MTTSHPAVAAATGARARAVAIGGEWRPLVLLLALGLPLLFAALDLELLDPDEGLYADIARTMYVSGDWVLPRFNGLPYLEKPPLLFWLGALTMRGDLAEWPLRLWSALAALGTVLLTWRIGRHLYGDRAGLLAGVAMITMVGNALYVRKLSTDFVFVFCLTLVMYGLTRDASAGERGRGRFLWCYAGAALALLSKGLIGLVFPALIVGLALAWTRTLTVRDLNLGCGSAVFTALALPWHAAAAWREPALFHFYVVDNQILRFLGGRGVVEDDVPMSTLGFLAVSFVWMFPWGVFLLARRAAGGARTDGWRALPVIWAAVIVIFFAMSRSKLEYYAVPAFPAVAILAGAAWASGRDIGRWLAVGLGGVVAFGLACLGLALRLTPEQTLFGLAELNVYYRILREQGLPLPFASVQPFATLLGGLGAVLVLGWGAAALCWMRARPRAAFACVVAMSAGIATLVITLLHVVEPHHSAKAVSAAITARLGADDVVVHEGSLEYSAALPFYTGRRVVIVNGARGDLDTASRLPEARGYFVDRDGLAALWPGPRRVLLVTQRPRARSVVGTLPSPVLIGQFGSRWLYSN
ncbi:MAG TPA: glycosyltransferase family 39 protein, partial [Candidatus Limnocylindria bacterium]|nr:glycosyltransferase family 39 protein [Candidatus Limnocylindria bacterium]